MLRSVVAALALALAAPCGALAPQPRDRSSALPALRALRGGAIPPPPAVLPSDLTALSSTEAADNGGGGLSAFWAEHRSLLLAIAGSLALLAPALSTLPRTAALTADIP